MNGTSTADFGGILGETFALTGDCLRWVLVFVAVVGGLTAAGTFLGYADPGSYLAELGLGLGLTEGDSLANAGFSLLLAVVNVVASYFLVQQLLVCRGRLAAGGTRIWAYVGLIILSALGVVLGLVFLIVPGIILMVRWIAATGYLLGEREGVVDSLKRSWHDTEGYAWPIFFAGLVLFVAYIALAAMIGGFAGVVGDEIAAPILTGILEAVGSALSLVFGIAVYVLVNEGTREVTEVFA